ncbi:MAG: Gfo/Idh/MocA family oxidoreductase [Anaerolineae bacterium]|nr:Gfo/Idh/MocA family oxidoreductase [Anaerolineae bacterium]
MTSREPVAVAIIGCGGMARWHIRSMLKQQATTHIAVVCEPSPEAYEATAQLFHDAGLKPPPNQPDLSRLLADYAGRLDAAFIVTPHAYHYEQARQCLEAGLDVLLEKPMVMNEAEARSLIETRDRTGRLLVVAFQGSLSPQIRTAVAWLRSGELGELLSVSATVWQEWGPLTEGTWRQQPELSGGGFLFDTGAHMLNTVADLAGEDFVEVAAWLDNHGRPVDTLAAVIGRLRSGALVTLHGCGEASSCASEIYVFCTKAVLRTGIWGERLEIQRRGRKRLRRVHVPPSLGVWEQFLAVREGRIPNPCPPEVGLRMARLWDAIRASAAQGGKPVQCA